MMIIHHPWSFIHDHPSMIITSCHGFVVLFCSRRLHRREIIALVVVLILSYYSNLLLLLTLLFWIFLGLLVVMMMVMVVVVVVLFLWFICLVCSGCFVCPLGVFFFFFFFFFECFPCGTIMLMVVPVWKACEKKAAYFPTIFLPFFRLGRLQFREYYRLLVFLVLYYSLACLQLHWLSTAAASMAVQAQYPSNALLPSYRNRLLPSPSLCLGFFLAMFFLFWLVGIGNWIKQCGLQVQNRERQTDRKFSWELQCSKWPCAFFGGPWRLVTSALGFGWGRAGMQSFVMGFCVGSSSWVQGQASVWWWQPEFLVAFELQQPKLLSSWWVSDSSTIP